MRDRNAYLGLVAQAIRAVNPDVFGQDLALLVKFHVFRQLKWVRSARSDGSIGTTYVGRIGHGGRFSLGSQSVSDGRVRCRMSRL